MRKLLSGTGALPATVRTRYEMFSRPTYEALRDLIAHGADLGARGITGTFPVEGQHGEVGRAHARAYRQRRRRRQVAAALAGRHDGR